MNIKTITLLTMVALALTTTLASASASDWTQFHCDVEHTGYSTSRAPNTDDIAWISSNIGAQSASSVTIADGRIFVYCWDYLVCMDEYTGEVLWNVSVENAKTNRSQLCGSWVTPAYHDGKVFLPAARTYCFNATDGSKIWAFTAPTGLGAVDGSVAIAEGNVITSDWDGKHYYGLNESDGTETWNFTVDDADAQSTPAISDGRVIVGSWTWGEGGHIYCVNLTTGSEEWNITTPDHPCGSAAISGDAAYMSTYNFGSTREPGELYALNLTNGSIIWSKPVERTDSTPAVAYGNVYVCGGCKGFSDLMTYCFNATTGDLIWNTSASDEIGNWKCSPAVADGKVFVGKPYFEGGVMDYVGTYALDASTGEIVWSYPEGGSSPAVADGKVFTIGSGRVYAFAPTFWSGDVSLGSGTFNVTADNSGKEYTINRTCALAALIRAAEKGGFNYTLNDSWYESYGSFFLESIAGVENEVWPNNTWAIYINDAPAPKGLGGNELEDGDNVKFYFCPANATTYEYITEDASYLLNITVGIIPEILFDGTVMLTNGTTFAFVPSNNASASYVVNLTTDIGALTATGLAFNASDSWYAAYGSFWLESIAGVENEVWPNNTWAIYINDAPAPKGLGGNELEDGDNVKFYFCPANATTYEYITEDASYLLNITVSVTLIRKGDANLDGSITVEDAALALQMAVGSVAPNEEADVNRDGAVTSLDALMILQAVAGSIAI